MSQTASGVAYAATVGSAKLTAARLASPLMPNPTWFMTLSSADLYWPELWMAMDPTQSESSV
eukprot:gene45771-57033_t